MFRWFSRRRHLERTAHDFYGSIVTASRRPEVYAAYGIPDTVEGRLELLTAHMFVALERLSGADEADSRIAQVMVDAFFGDMDTSARELGVGDMAVPGKMRQLATLVNHRWDSYREAIRAGDGQRFAALVGNAFPDPEGTLAGEPLADYLRSMLDELRRMPAAALKEAILAASTEAFRKTQSIRH